MTNVVGISCGSHDAAVAVLRDGEIVFASHCERYSRVKNDPWLSPECLRDAVAYVDRVDAVVYYERPWFKRARQLRSGQMRALAPGGVRARLRSHPALRGTPVAFVDHHLSHAAGGYYTSGFADAVVVVVDAIGEWATVSVWAGRGDGLRRLFAVNYPHSIGLLYSAFTQHLGFKPNEEEYIVMGLAAFGQPDFAEVIWDDFVAGAAWPDFRLKRSVHRGIAGWRPSITDRAAIAASIQLVTEKALHGLFAYAARTVGSRNLVYSGGVALNCRFNTELAKSDLFDQIWIMPNPGDAGSSLGAALAHHGKHVAWPGPYLGHDVGESFDLAGALSALLAGKVIGLARGRAEFGPRALGNRSLVTDPRHAAAKRRVNDVKRREPFRPFAPAVLAEHAEKLFEMPVRESPYMQFVAPCRQTEEFFSVCHVDGTSRVQTLTRGQNPVFHRLLEEFYAETGCPALLNTSLNIKGEPMVNDRADADRFSARYGIPVF